MQRTTWMILALTSALSCGGTSGDSGGGGEDGLTLTGADSTTGSATDTGGQDIGPCADLIECSAAAGTGGTSGLIATYGAEGECYDLPGVTPQDCWADCVALLDDFAMLYPDVLECIDGTTTAGEGCGDQPGTGVYSDCTDGLSSCTADGFGVTNPDSGNCYCTAPCVTDLDCPSAPCSAVPVCFPATVNGGDPYPYCALDCSAGDCPNGMLCHSGDFNGSTVSHCI